MNNNLIPKFLKPFTKPLRPYYLPLYMKFLKPKPDPEGLQLYPHFVTMNDVVIEVGSGIGGSTVLLSKMAKHVYSFEPNPYSFKLLKYFTKKKKNVTVFEYGCGDENKETTLNLMENNLYSTITSIKNRKDVQYTKKEIVKIIRLDDFEFGIKPTMLILDCTGYENEVIKGSRKILEKIDKVLVELHSTLYVKNILKNIKLELEDFNQSIDDSTGWLIATKKRSK